MRNLHRYFVPPLLSLLGALSLLQLSCRKFVDIPPPETELSAGLVFQDDATATAAIAGIYKGMSTNSFVTGSGSSLSIYMAAYADELRYYPGISNPGTGMGGFFNNNVQPTEGLSGATWQQAYGWIYNANRILEGLEATNGVSDATRRQLRGEALFLRAFCHFYLVNLFGDVPYIRGSDYRANSVVSRTPAATVYEGISADLSEAQTLLSDTYPGTGRRSRVNKGAATALLARVLLYREKWSEAEAQASAVISHAPQYQLQKDLNQSFIKNNSEAILQIMPAGVDTTYYTDEGAYLILQTTPTGRCSLTDGLMNAFEGGDARQSQWTGKLTVGLSSWYYPYKYKGTYSNIVKNEYVMVLRLAEQYLIRAEARVRQGKLSEAAADIDSLRLRAGLSKTTASDPGQLMAAIEQERRVELFTEWGHRFFDLKRWGKLDAVLGPAKPGWNARAALLPIPQSELLANKNLRQNPGY